MTEFVIEIVDSSKFGVVYNCIYPEGIMSHSPGLPATAGYPGMGGGVCTTLKGLRHSRISDDGTPSGYIDCPDSQPRVARFASNPGLCDTTPSE